MLKASTRPPSPSSLVEYTAPGRCTSKCVAKLWRMVAVGASTLGFSTCGKKHAGTATGNTSFVAGDLRAPGNVFRLDAFLPDVLQIAQHHLVPGLTKQGLHEHVPVRHFQMHPRLGLEQRPNAPPPRRGHSYTIQNNTISLSVIS